MILCFTDNYCLHCHNPNTSITITTQFTIYKNSVHHNYVIILISTNFKVIDQGMAFQLPKHTSCILWTAFGTCLDIIWFFLFQNSSGVYLSLWWHVKCGWITRLLSLYFLHHFALVFWCCELTSFSIACLGLNPLHHMPAHELTWSWYFLKSSLKSIPIWLDLVFDKLYHITMPCLFPFGSVLPVCLLDKFAQNHLTTCHF